MGCVRVMDEFIDGHNIGNLVAVGHVFSFGFHFYLYWGFSVFSHGVLCNFVVSFLFILSMSMINLSKYLAHYRDILFCFTLLEMRSVILGFATAPESLPLMEVLPVHSEAVCVLQSAINMSIYDM